MVAIATPEPFALPVSSADLDRLEEVLRRSVLGGDEFLNEVASHLIEAGGKRLRPALTIASALLGDGPVTDETLLGGVSVELVHLASLYHDDVMDEATRRRGVDSVNSRWGNIVAIVAGDFLLARSAEIAASLGSEIAGLLASTLARLCQGQVSETRTSYQADRNEKTYLAAIGDKTAALMSTACRIGALTAGLDRERVGTLTRFGECFGMVFQIRDDILDIVGTEAELGKKPCQDLVEGIYTLPVLRAMTHPGAGPELSKLLGRRLDDDEVARAKELVLEAGGIEAADDVALIYAGMAADAAGELGESVIASALGQLGTAITYSREH